MVGLLTMIFQRVGNTNYTEMLFAWSEVPVLSLLDMWDNIPSDY